MVSDINVLDSVLTIISGAWSSTNTDSKTPVFKKIYEIPKELDMNNDYILVYSDPVSVISPGIGATTVARIEEHIKIDVRVYGLTDTHARKVLAELRRILHNKVISPDSNFEYLNPFKDIIDLSDKTRKIFRYIVQIDMIDCIRTLGG